jgi:hypothetical protein
VVGGSPGLSEADAIGLVGILGLEITKDDTGLVVALTVDLEGLYRESRGSMIWPRYEPFNTLLVQNTYNTIGSSGLDFKLDGTDREVLGKKILAGFTNVVERNRDSHLNCKRV